MPWLLRSLQAFFGLLLLTTAVGKLLDNRGFAEVIATYQFFIPEPLLLPLGLAVSLVELAMAIAIFAGWQLTRLAQATILMHLGYMVLATITNLRDLELDNCGCFGVFLARPMAWSTVIEDGVLTALGILFYVAARGRTSAQSASGSAHHGSASTQPWSH